MKSTSSRVIACASSILLFWHEQHGQSPDEIVSQIPSITLADVHAALAYYYDHSEEIQDEIQSEKEAEAAGPDEPSLLSAKVMIQEALTWECVGQSERE